MFVKDSIGNIERHSIYLSKPSGEILECLDEFINEGTASLKLGLNQQQELSFEVNKLDNDWYDYLQEGMYLAVETVGLFKMRQPTITGDGVKEIKNVTAYSCDSELEDKNINIEINMGTKTSQEYLVQYDALDAGEEIVNPYTGVPYDWLVLYNTFPEQLRAHLYDYDHGVFGTASNGEIVVTERAKIDKLNTLFNLIPRLKNKFEKTYDEETGSSNYTLIEYADVTYNNYNGEIASITLYSGYRGRISYLINFYERNREQLSLLSVVLAKTGGVWQVGDIYGVSDGDYTLANKKYQFEISENIYSFLATTLAQTTNCMVNFDIVNRKVNVTPVEYIGKNTGITLSYDNLLNSLDIESEEDNLFTRLIVTGGEDLSIEQVNFGLNYIDDLSYKMNAVDDKGKRIYVSNALATKYANYINTRERLRTEYVQLSKDYRNYTEQIDEIRNRVPLDDLKTDWGTFTEDELTVSLTAYKNLLASLISLYRSEFYPQGINEDDSVNESFMRTTVYWQDYEAYKNIITEIECAIATFPYYSDHDKWSEYNKILYEDAIKEWETEWTLYGIDELQAKIASYKNNMEVLAESSVIKVSADSDEIKAWDDLTEDEQTTFGGISDNYKYDLYMSYYNNALDAKDYLDELQEQVDELTESRSAAQSRRNEIVNAVSLESNFTAKECKEISLLIREGDCNNENILITSIDSANDKIDRMFELLEYGQEQLSIMCRPQLTFTISSDNLLALTEFENFWKDFNVGNYILVQYRDDTYMKLRLVEYEYNPCLPSSDSFTITFSNYVRSKVGVTDLESILGLASSTSGSGGSGSSSGSGGNYGESDDIDITISNTMLAKLLNSELFGTRVSDVILNTIDVNSITAKYATFNGLASGVTIIDGQCITTGWIKSLDYNGTSGGINNTTGSILNLNNGYFNFGGGKVKYNGTTLTVDGNIVATTLSTGGRTSSSTGHDGVYIDSQGNLYSGSTNGVIIYKDGKFNFANGKITYNGSLVNIASDVVIGADTTVGQALQDIVTAQTTADKKSRIYYGSPTTVVPPTYDELQEGDYLVDTSTGSTYRWSSGDNDWIEATNYNQAIIDAIEEIIIPQIDGKIETWTQNTNPASSWLSTDLERHNGDLWYYIGTTDLTVGTLTVKPSKTYKYVYNTSTQTGAWQLYNSPNKSIFDVADGKSTIFYGDYPFTSITEMQDRDFAVDDTTQKIYRYDADDAQWVEVTNYKGYVDSEVSALEDELIEQIDAKIETWAKSSDPAASWAVADYDKHSGDLWLYTGKVDMVIGGVTIHPQGIYKFTPLSSNEILDESGNQITDESSNGLILENAYSWVEYSSVTSNIFDLADGKSTIHYGIPTGSYSGLEVGDYLVDPTDGSTYKWDGVKWAEMTNYSESIDSAVNALRSTLETQIDAKVETWAQLSDPSTNWAEEVRPEHDGDLWYYTGTENSTVEDSQGNPIHPSKTYQYDADNNVWVIYNSPSKSLFDFADGKSTVYYGAPSSVTPSTKPLEVDDYLVDNTDGCTYKWSGSQWVKVTDYEGYTDDAIAVAKSELEAQIDAKVETWAQSSNPALSWSFSSFEAHNGDLWLYTGLTDMVIGGVTIRPQGIYKFTYSTSTNTAILDESSNTITDESGNALEIEIAYSWVAYSSVSTNVFDLADGKSTIFYGAPTSTYPDVDEEDYLVNNENGMTYRRTGGQWVAVTKAGGLYGTCSSLATAKEKVVVCSNSVSVYEGLTLSVKFENANTFYSNTAPLTLNVGKLGVKNIYYDGAVISSTNRMYWSAGATIMFMYDGNGWVVIGHPETYNGSCSTAAGTAAKSCSIADAVIVKGTVVNITFTETNSASSPTLNVIDNTTNAPTITVNASNNTLSSSSQYNWNAGATVGFTFDGQRWKLNDSSALYNTNSYMRFESTGTAQGLMIANMRNGVVSNDAITTPNTLLTSSDLQIRYGQTVLAKYGSSIELASSGATITIGSTSSYNTVVNSSGMSIRSNKTTLASFGSTITIGNTSSYNTVVSSSGMSIKNSETTLASFGSSITLASSGATITIGSTSSYNTVVNSSGMSIRSNETTLASFGSTITIGQANSSSSQISISSSGMNFTYQSTTVMSILNDSSRGACLRVGTSTDGVVYAKTGIYWQGSGVNWPVFTKTTYNTYYRRYWIGDPNTICVQENDGTVAGREYLETYIGMPNIVWLGRGSGGNNHGVYSSINSKWLIYSDGRYCCSQLIFENTTSSAGNIYIGTGDNKYRMYRSTASSKRYKKDIVDIEDVSLDPHKLYDIKVRQFKYKAGYLNSDDQRYDKNIPGFIAEELSEIYPIAVEYNSKTPEDWNVRYIIPPMLKLIQEQKAIIDDLICRVSRLEQTTS